MVSVVGSTAPFLTATERPVQDLVQAVEARLSDSFSCRQADLPEKMKMVVEAVVTPPPEQPESCSAPPVHRVRAARPTRASLLSFEVGLAVEAAAPLSMWPGTLIPAAAAVVVVER